MTPPPPLGVLAKEVRSGDCVTCDSCGAEDIAIAGALMLGMRLIGSARACVKYLIAMTTAIAPVAHEKNETATTPPGLTPTIAAAA